MQCRTKAVALACPIYTYESRLTTALEEQLNSPINTNKYILNKHNTRYPIS